MEALHDVVKAGKARYIGASTMCAWQFAKAQEVARTNGWTRFVSMQNQINLIYRQADAAELRDTAGTWREQLIHPDDRVAVEAAIADARRSGRAISPWRTLRSSWRAARAGAAG